MKVIVGIILSFFVTVAHAQAFATAIMCDTLEQVRALAETKIVPEGCGQARFLYVSSEKVEEMQTADEHRTLLKITVVGIVEKGALLIFEKPMTQFIARILKINNRGPSTEPSSRSI